MSIAYVDVVTWYELEVIRRTPLLPGFGEKAFARRWGAKWLVMNTSRDRYELLSAREIERHTRDLGAVAYNVAEDLEFDLDYLCPVPPHRAA